MLHHLCLQNIPQNLEELSFHACAISDGLLATLFPRNQVSLPHLRVLDLSATFVTSRGLQNLPDSLRKLQLGGCGHHIDDSIFSGQLPSSIQELDLTHCHLNGATLATMPTSLTSLSLDYNPLRPEYLLSVVWPPGT